MHPALRTAAGFFVLLTGVLIATTMLLLGLLGQIGATAQFNIHPVLAGFSGPVAICIGLALLGK